MTGRSLIIILLRRGKINGLWENIKAFEKLLSLFEKISRLFEKLSRPMKKN
jgi:hypothetical protein